MASLADDFSMALPDLVPTKVREGFVMTSIDALACTSKNPFDVVTESFLQQPGLPFSEVLSAETIRRAFGEQGNLFANGRDEIFSTQIVLWAFLAQSLRDGKGAACAEAVADIATYMQQTGGRAPSGDTGDYCRARAKLSPDAVHSLARQAAVQLEDRVPEDWLWHGLHAKLVDGFTFTMPDTPDNQQQFPQQKNQRPGAGFPIARACAVLSLATAAILDLNVTRYQGKETGESALLRGMLEAFRPGEVAVFDRCYCSFLLLATVAQRGVHFCARLHQRRPHDFRKGKRLGPGDHLITWTRPKRPEWMSEEAYQQIPQTLTLREVRFNVRVPGRRTKTLIIVTSLLDPEQCATEEIAELYGFRWNAELDIRAIKQTLGLDHVRCKSPKMVRLEIWVTLLAYNLIRTLIGAAAHVYGKQPRQLGFTLACQTVLSSWMLMATGACRDPQALWQAALERIAANEVANRPDRIEPRMLKRNRQHYPLMHEPRQRLRRKLLCPNGQRKVAA